MAPVGRIKKIKASRLKERDAEEKTDRDRSLVYAEAGTKDDNEQNEEDQDERRSPEAVFVAVSSNGITHDITSVWMVVIAHHPFTLCAKNHMDSTAAYEPR